jgi:glutamate 5-kinase
LWSADALILFSDIEGIFTDNPKTNPKAELIEEVTSIEDLRKKITIGETNAFGTGGIETKIQAAEKSTKYGIPMILANGGQENILDKLANGSAKGTLFLAQE